jgi:ankyrin repeat protein
MECEFCKKSFSSKNTLGTHQKTTKRCLEIQKNLKENKQETNEKDEDKVSSKLEVKLESKDEAKDDKLESKDEIDIEAKCKILEEENQRLKNRIKEKDEGYNALINRILYEKNSYIHILETKLNSFYEAQAKAKAKAELEEDIDMIDLVHGYLALTRTGRDNHDDSVLIWASRFNQDDMVRTLIERGVDINEPATSDGRTALDIWEKKSSDMVEFLREHGGKKRCELNLDNEEDEDDDN